MNIAFPAVVILLFSFPGILLRYTYRKGFFGRSPVALNSITEELSAGILLSLIVHVVGIFFVVDIIGEQINFKSIMTLLSGWPKEDKTSIDQVWSSVEQKGQVVKFASYVLGTNVAASLIGYLAFSVVRGLRLDLICKVFRFNNDWYYLFSGEILTFTTFQSITPLFKSLWVDSVVIARMLSSRLFRLTPLVGCNDIVVLKSYSEGCRALRELRNVNVVLSITMNFSSGVLCWEGYLEDYSMSKNGELEFLLIKPIRVPEKADLYWHHIQLRDCTYVKVSYADVHSLGISYESVS